MSRYENSAVSNAGDMVKGGYRGGCAVGMVYRDGNTGSSIGRC